MGHARPFAFDDAYQPAEGINRFLTGTPSILGLAALNAGLDTFEGVSMAALAAKSRGLSSFSSTRSRRAAGTKFASPRPAIRFSAAATSSSPIPKVMQ